MTQMDSHFEKRITQIRPMPPGNDALAQADAHVEVAGEIFRLVVACMRHGTR
jgi:hypothetical protein